VGAFLLEMDGRMKSTGAVALPMSRRDIADYLGLSIETVSRVLHAYQRKGYLKVGGSCQRDIVVLSPTGLAEETAAPIYVPSRKSQGNYGSRGY
jgi:CRP/FNR family nitrogen fixation transcriptional regulator